MEFCELNFQTLAQKAMNEYFVRARLRDSTKIFYCAAMTKVISALGMYDIRDIDAEIIQCFLNMSVVKGNDQLISHRTISAWITVLNTTFRYAQRKNFITRNPMNDDIIMPEVAEDPCPDDRFLTGSQIESVLHAVAGHPLYATITQALLLSGLRIGELLALRKCDLLPEKCMVRVRHSLTREIIDEREGKPKVRFVVGDTKTKSSRRSVYVSPLFFVILDSWIRYTKADKRYLLAAQKGLHGYVFINRNGDLFNYSALRHNYTNYLRRHDVHFRVTLHMLRHCYVSYMLTSNTGIRIEDLSRQVGHRSIRTTYDIYWSQTEEGKEKLAQAGTLAFEKFVSL